jgi:hypothetical protein
MSLNHHVSLPKNVVGNLKTYKVFYFYDIKAEDFFNEIATLSKKRTTQVACVNELLATARRIFMKLKPAKE